MELAIVWLLILIPLGWIIHKGGAQVFLLGSWVLMIIGGLTSVASLLLR